MIMLPLSTAQIQKNPRHTSLSKDKRGVWKVGELSRHATCLKSHPFYCPGLLIHKRLCQEHLQRHLWTGKYWINVHTKQQHLICNNNNMRQKMNTNTRAASGECLGVLSAFDTRRTRYVHLPPNIIITVYLLLPCANIAPIFTCAYMLI